jgi:radical SAM-linked protein
VRARLRFSKLGKLRFLSRRDLARLWERSLRRAGVQVAYSEGFSPRPRLHFGLALSTGHESLGEYLDIDLLDLDAGAGGVEHLPAAVADVLPAGIEAQASVPLAPGTESLQQSVTSCTWEIEVLGVEPSAVADAVGRALDAPTLPLVVERKGSPVELDARPAIAALEVAPQGAGTAVLAELATQPRSLRPAELVRALDPGWREGRVLRTHQWTLVDGARREPIPLPEGGARGALATPHAGARAR